MLSSKTLRAFLDDANRDAKTNGLHLREQIANNENDALDIMKGGSVSSTSANGRHVALAGRGGGTYAQAEIAEGWRRLLDCYDINAPTLDLDAAVAAMKAADLREVTGYTNNFMYLSK